MTNKLHKLMMVTLIIILPILFSCATPPPAPRKPTPENYHNTGSSHRDAGQFEQAISAFNKRKDLGSGLLYCNIV
jgi:hypothetical protein